MNLRTFRIGGVHPEENKITAEMATQVAPLPKQAIFPLGQHIGAPAKPVVAKGDKVKVGTLIAEAGGFVSAPIYSSVSGTVFKVDTSIDATGYRKPCIIINVEGDEWEESIDRSDKLETLEAHTELTPEEIVNRIKEAGVTGMGGAGFPTFIKLCPPPGAKAECVIINGVECEPYITADYRLMMEHADEILVGLNLLMKAAKVEKGYIGIEDNKPVAIKLFEEKTANDSRIEIVPLAKKYPYAALANRTRRAPGFALLGEPGEERDVILELKSIADVALVGFPSAGKSSLIAAMSSAKPKIADYPFTTLVPNLGVVVAGDMRYTIADVPGLIPGASQGKGLGLEFLRHIERTEIIAHVIDCATLEPGRDPMSDYQALEHELAEYAGKLELPLGAIPIPERPRIIILNKVDVPEAKELAEFVKPEFEKLGLKVHIISTASHEGLKELNWALADLVTNMRAEVAKREQAEEEARVVIKPLEEPRNRRRRNDEGGNALDFTVERKENGNGEVWYEVLGTKPERWVMQTNFDNDEAVGYLADRLAKLGVEDELRHKGAKPGDEVRIGRGDRAVEFDWDPTIAAGAEMLDGTQLGARGVDLRLQESDGRAQRRSNTERRRQYHEMMDARQAVREAMMAERKAGHWADPSVDDDRHDETSLFGRGETADDEDVEQ